MAVLDIITATLKEVESSPPPKSRIDMAVTQIETRKVVGLEKIGGFGGKAEQFQSYNHFAGNPDYFAQDLKRYHDVSPESVAKVVKDYLQKDKRGVLVAMPESAAAKKEVAQ